MLRADRQRLLEIAAWRKHVAERPAELRVCYMRVLFRATRVPALDGSGSTAPPPVHECARGGSVGDERSSLLVFIIYRKRTLINLGANNE